MAPEWLWPVAIAVASIGFSLGAARGPGLVDTGDGPDGTSTAAAPTHIPAPRFETEVQYAEGRLRAGACADVRSVDVALCSGGPAPGEASWRVQVGPTVEQLTIVVEWDAASPANEDLTVRISNATTAYVTRGASPLRLALAQEQARVGEGTIEVWWAPTTYDRARAYVDQPFSMRVEMTHRFDPPAQATTSAPEHSS